MIELILIAALIFTLVLAALYLRGRKPSGDTVQPTTPTQNVTGVLSTPQESPQTGELVLPYRNEGTAVSSQAGQANWVTCPEGHTYRKFTDKTRCSECWRIANNIELAPVEAPKVAEGSHERSYELIAGPEYKPAQLEALLPETVEEIKPIVPTITDNTPRIDAARIKAGDNDRKHFDEVELQALADNIAANGLLQPITVRPVDNDMYEIVAGERRFRAMMLLGWTEVPANIRIMSDQEAAINMFSENMARVDINPIEQALAYRKMMKQFAWSHADLVDKTGQSKETVKGRLSLLRLTEDVQGLVASGNLPLNYAACMVDLDANRQALALRYFSESKRPNIGDFRGLCNSLVEQQAQDSMFDLDTFMQASNSVQEAMEQARKIRRYPVSAKMPAMPRANSVGLALEKYIALLIDAGLNEQAEVTGSIYDGLLKSGLAKQPKDSPLPVPVNHQQLVSIGA